MKRFFVAAALAVLAYAIPGEAAAAGACPSNFQGHQSLTCTCTAGAMTGTVWGSGPYTTDSSVCAAALHAGAVAKTGGTVTVQATAGCASYSASKNNGVASSSYGPWAGSFYFPSVGSPNCPGVVQMPTIPAMPSAVAACPSTYQGVRGALTCQCTSAAFRGQVWGTATYTEDSSICNAALHAGAVAKTGGIVTVQAARGCNHYSGSTNNGVASADYGAWGASFYFPSIGGGGCPAERPGHQRPRPPGR